jgi:outer membrane protein insertion porin family
MLPAGQALGELPIFGKALGRLSASAGMQLGDLPPYDAHPLGGVNCVRGYDEGAIGTARHWAVLNMELEASMFQDAFKGLLFVDAGSDLNSGQTVVGDPAGTRGKPGKGLGYGVGMRVGSPMGLIRFEYGWNDKAKWAEEGRATVGKGRLHIGIGSRF